MELGPLREGAPFIILTKVLYELAQPCSFGTVGPAVTVSSILIVGSAMRTGLVLVQELQKSSPCVLFMGRDFHHHAQLNQRGQLKIVNFVMRLEKYVQNKLFRKYHYLWKDTMREKS